jgi:SAM-dependent methyltransferase
MEFYDQLAVDYDQMIGFNDRVEKETVVFREILRRFPAETILDAGCGTGFHSIVFALLGKKVIGFDNSPEMLSRARENARQWQVTPGFVSADFLDFNHKIPIRSNAIFCLGNSYAHLLSADQRTVVLQNFKRALTHGGYVFLQIMNHDKILKERPQIFSVKEYNHRKYTRLYQYLPSTVIFTIRIETPAGNREISNELFPLQAGELSRLAADNGFIKIKWYGNPDLSEYDQFGSENICVVLSTE